MKKNNRGHGLKEIVKATKLLKNAGIKICYHMMPNLPGSNLRKDLKMFKIIFSDSRFQPDMLKIYPCVVVKEAPLYKIWRQGKYKTYSSKILVELLLKIKLILPEYVRVNRLGRDIPIGNIQAGFKESNIRQILERRLKKLGKSCQCIRCREIKSDYRLPTRLKVTKYPASRGTEYFLQFVDKNNRLYGLLRLRIPDKKTKKNHFIKQLKKSSIVRELHVYGPSLPVGAEPEEESQHRGLGKKLLQKAEEITQKEGLSKIAVIAAIGTRDYYRGLGYKLEGEYVVKGLTSFRY